jgi:hypothetical protein
MFPNGDVRHGFTLVSAGVGLLIAADVGHASITVTAHIYADLYGFARYPYAQACMVSGELA